MVLCPTKYAIDAVAYHHSSSFPYDTCSSLREEDADLNAGLVLLGVASSVCEGSKWGGAIHIVDGGEGGNVVSNTLEIPYGISQLAWVEQVGPSLGIGKQTKSAHSYLMAAGDDGSVHVFRVTRNPMNASRDTIGDDEERRKMTMTIEVIDSPMDDGGHEDIMSCLSISKTDQCRLISGSFDRSLRLWEWNSISPKAVRTFEGM